MATTIGTGSGNPSGPEEKVWEGHPSHWTNLGVYLLCGLFSWLVVPLFIGIYKWMALRNQRYELTTQRLKVEEGVFNLKQDVMELYRVKDITVIQPVMLRMFNLGNVVLETSDKTTPRLELKAIRAREVADLIRTQVETMRQTRNVREVDVD